MTFNPSELSHSLQPKRAAMRLDQRLIPLANELFTLADTYDWPYQHSWLGVPVLQAPEDLIGIAQLIFCEKPALIVETGVAYGGLTLFVASLCQLTQYGRVVGIDLNLHDNVLQNIGIVDTSSRITLIRGDSVDPAVFDKVSKELARHETALVILDSDHSHEHVFQELELWSRLNARQVLILVTDTIIKDIPNQLHRPRPWNKERNPATALESWLKLNSDYSYDDRYFGSCLLTMNRGGLISKSAARKDAR